MKKYFKDYFEDPQGEPRTGDIAYVSIVILMALFFIPSFCVAQCWEEVRTDECYLSCNYQLSITPSVQYKFVEDKLYFKAEKCTTYDIITTNIMDCSVQGVCSAKDYWQGTFKSNCCETIKHDTLYECGLFEAFNHTEYISDCQCDTVVNYTTMALPKFHITDTILHLENDLTIDSLQTVNGCDSIITTHWVATNFEDEGTINNYEVDNNDDGNYSLPPGKEMQDITEVGNETLIDQIEPLKTYFPNIISADGNGVNDCFQAFTNGPLIQKLIIADRWGNIITKRTNLKSGECAWNGTYRGYKVQGVFVYSAIINNKVFKGDFTSN